MPETKQNMLVEIPMYITKAVMDGKAMKWQATNSDTDPDSYEERMSLELYQDFINRIAKKEPVPDIFKSNVCSDYWQGGMPYLSVSHYPDLNGQAVPGDVVKLYVDGNKLKAKGTLYSTPLGHSVFRALQEDKNKNPEEKIRISIGFLDLAHKHGNGKVWVRDSLTSICQECLDGIGEKIYVKGYLVHLALTRVPVNKRTEMLLEEKSMSKKITRKEDAASIVGEVIASEIDIKNKAQALKSDVLIEMSEGEEQPVAEPVVEESEAPVVETPQVELSTAENDPEKECSEGDQECADKMKQKSEPVVEEAMDEPMMLPYSGAVSMKEAQKARDTMEEMEHVMDLWGMFSNVAWNIIDRGDVTDKKAAFVKALDEFKGMLAAKAMVEFSQAKPEPVVKKSENEHELKPALDVLLSAIDNSLTFEGDVAERLKTINPVLQEVGTAISDYVTRKSVANSEPPALDKNNDNLLEEIKKIIQPLSESVATLKGQVGILEAKSVGTDVQPKSRIPQPRSMRVQPVVPTATLAQEQTKPGSIKSIVRKSVGLEQ